MRNENSLHLVTLSGMALTVNLFQVSNGNTGINVTHGLKAPE